MGPHWESEMAHEMEALADMIDYLQTRGVRVVAFEFPLGSWFRELPYAPAFRSQITRACSKRSVPFIDLSDLLDDSDFDDSSHLNHTGQHKLHPVLMEIVLPGLHRASALPHADSDGD